MIQAGIASVAMVLTSISWNIAVSETKGLDVLLIDIAYIKSNLQYRRF